MLILPIQLYPGDDFTADLGPPIEKPAYRYKDDGSDPSFSISAHPRPPTAATGPLDHTSPSSVENFNSHSNANSNAHATTSGTSPDANPADDEDSGAASSENEYEPTRLLEDKLKDLTLDPLVLRYFGKSSPFRLLQTAAGFGSELSGKRVDGNKFWRSPKPPRFMDPYRVSSSLYASKVRQYVLWLLDELTGMM